MASNLPALKKLVSEDSVLQRIQKTCDNSEAFTASLVNLVAESDTLQKCEPKSIMAAAMKAAALNLPIDKSLGRAYVVPYGKEAQFQLSYKGLITLAINSGQYTEIDATPVYRDEFEKYNPITKEFIVKDDIPENGDRANNREPHGYYAHMTLKNGYKNSVYMTREQVLHHAKKFSKTYQSALKYGKTNSIWHLHEEAMGCKTVMKKMLNTYGILSIEMADAMSTDNKNDSVVTDAETGKTVEAPSKEKEVKPEPKKKAPAKKVEKPVEKPVEVEATPVDDSEPPLTDDDIPAAFMV